MISFGMVMITIPLVNFAVIFSRSMLVSNLTVFTHLPLFNADTIVSAVSSSSNSSMYGLKVVSMVMSLSPASINTSSLVTPGTAALM